MKKFIAKWWDSFTTAAILAIVLYIVATCGGCTSAQRAAAADDLQKIERGIHSATLDAQAIVAAYEAHEATFDEVIEALQKITPKTSAAHNAALDALDAATTLKAHPEALADVKEALAKVAGASAPTTPSIAGK